MVCQTVLETCQQGLFWNCYLAVRIAFACTWAQTPGEELTGTASVLLPRAKADYDPCQLFQLHALAHTISAAVLQSALIKRWLPLVTTVTECLIASAAYCCRRSPTPMSNTFSVDCSLHRLDWSVDYASEGLTRRKRSGFTAFDVDREL